MHKIVAVVLFDGQPRPLVLATEECATALLFFGESLPGQERVQMRSPPCTVDMDPDFVIQVRRLARPVRGSKWWGAGIRGSKNVFVLSRHPGSRLVPYLNNTSRCTSSPEQGTVVRLSSDGVIYPSGYVVGIKGWDEVNPVPKDTIFRVMLFGEDLAVVHRDKPPLWEKLPHEMKVEVLSHLPLGTLLNVCRFVSNEFNFLVHSLVFRNHIRVQHSGVVPGGLTEVEFSTMCASASRTARSLTVVGDRVQPQAWTFQGIERVLLSTNWYKLTTLVVKGDFRSWCEDGLVSALRRGLLCELDSLELVQENVLQCRNLFGWILPKLQSLAVNVGGGIRDFLLETPARGPFDGMPKLANFRFLSLDHHVLYVSGFLYPVSALLDAVLTQTVQYVRIHTYPWFFRFSAMNGVFPNVHTIHADPQALKHPRLPSNEPRSMLRVFPSVRKVYVTWDVSTNYAPSPLKGVEFMQHLFDTLGDGWEGETKVIKTLEYGRKASGVRFEKR